MSDPEFPWLDESQSIGFPDPSLASKEGILCYGGNLSPGMLLSAYRQGVFPWYSDDQPLLWWSPDPRFVLYPEEIHISGSMKKLLKKKPFRVTLDKAFSRVMEGCAESSRRNQEGTWITGDMQGGYRDLHDLGYAHSVEVWDGDALAGGLYGVSLGSLFFGESMFTRVANASKYGFIVLVETLKAAGFSLIDSQVYTSHVEKLGGRNIPRELYLKELGMGLKRATLKGRWDELIPEIVFPEV